MTDGREEKAPRFAAIGGHHSHRSGTVEWVTPPELIAALGPFDLDPCAGVLQPWPCATRSFTVTDNGLRRPWAGRVWLNPPYANGVIEKWLARMAEHDNGTALIFARTETDAFFEHVWNRASALLFMRGRINFHFGAPTRDKAGKEWKIGDRAPGNAGAPTVLCAYGINDADVLAACRIAGRFVPLRFPRFVLVSLINYTNEDEKNVVTWREALADFFADQKGPVELDDSLQGFCLASEGGRQSELRCEAATATSTRSLPSSRPRSMGGP